MSKEEAIEKNESGEESSSPSVLRDNLLQGYYLVRKPRKISEALKQFLAPSYVEAVQKRLGSERFLLEVIAQERGFNPVALLQEVAQRLDMLALEELHLPPQDLIHATGADASLLAQRRLVPQRVLNGQKNEQGYEYLLVVANPVSVEREVLEQQGVGVALALESAIDGVWRRYLKTYKLGKGGEVAEVQKEEVLIGVIERLVDDAARAGAKEVFLGYPTAGKFAFVTADGRFEGDFSERLLQLLRAKCIGHEGQAKLIGLFGSREVLAGITQAAGAVFVCLHWRDIDLQQEETSPLFSREIEVEVTAQTQGVDIDFEGQIVFGQGVGIEHQHYNGQMREE